MYKCRLLLYFTFIFISGCKSRNNLTLEIPNAFKGVIVITQNDLANDTNLKVNDEGFCKVKNLNLFYDWHRVNTTYSNGLKLRYMNDGGQGGIAIWPASSVKDNEILFYVGTEEDFKIFSESNQK